MNKTKKKKILGRVILIAMITSMFMVVSPMTASAATGDDCTDPIVVSISGDLPYTDTGQTTCGRVDDYDATCLGSYDGGEDIIYRLDVTADTCIDIEMDPKGTTYTGLMIDDNCPGDDGSCIASDTGSSGTRELSGILLTAGNSYYIMVDTWPAPNCIPDFDLTITECVGPSPGDDCDHPIYVDIPADLTYTDIDQTTCGRIDDYDSTCLGNYDGGEDIIYQLNVTSATKINVTLDPKGTTYTGILIDDECPDTGVCINHSTNSGASPHGFTADLTAGTYYIMVDTYPAPDCIPDFNLTIEEIVPPCLEIEKKVYNGTEWVDEISGAELGNIYRFRINVTSSCCDFTDVVVKDTLSSSLAYEDDASPFEPNSTVGNVHYWNFSALNKDETITIEFNVSVSAYGYDCNVANVTANCTDTGVIHSAEDDACIKTRVMGAVHPTDPAANYATIGAAIAAASDGDAIEVWNSTYYENVVVNKRLTIYSRDGADVTIVDGGGSGHVFKVEAPTSRVNITGFTVTNSGSAGIYVHSDHNNITGNTVNNNNGHGIDMDGDHNNITGNTVNDNDGYGIILYSADYNNIMDNIVSNNGESGIFLSSYCSDNVVSTNTITNNGKIGTWSKAGIRLNNADYNEIVCNLVAYNAEKGFYLHGGSTGNNISCNNIVANGVFNAATGGYEWNFHNMQSYNNIDAYDNYWCTDEDSVKNAGINEDPGTVDSDPFAASPVPCAPMAPCPCFMVSKTVWNGTAWVDEISDAQLGTTYRFRINVTSMCCDFTDLVVTDTLPGGLAYHGNAIPLAPTQVGSVYQWTFPTLNKGETKTIEFDVINNGYGCNLVNATAYSPDTGESSGNDTACITAGRDLEVTKIYINTDCHPYDRQDQIFVNESNRIGARIENNGPGDIAVDESFDVCFDANGVRIGCVNVTGGLAASDYKRVYIHWTPSCADYPNVMPGYPPTSMPVTINATVDCNCTGSGACPVCIGDGRIKEADEGNNKFSGVIPATKSGGRYVCGVVNNGYKSKNFDCNLTEEPLALFEYDQFYGGIDYNVSGRKYEGFGPGFTDTRIHHIDIPPGMTIKKARLFVYWYDWSTEPGHLANLSVNFCGTTFTTPDAKYIDQKGFAWYNYPKGTYAYDVTSLVTTGSNDYTAIVKNIDPTTPTNLLGELLLVVYEDPSQDPDNHIQLWLMEGCDLLMGDAHFCVTPEEATATATFAGTAVSNPESAELITVVAQGMEPGSNMLFNGNIIKTNAWDAGSEAGPKTNWLHGSKINVEVVDVTSNMASSDNTVGFQDTGTAGMQASNAILVVKYEKEAPTEPDLNVTEKFEEWVNETHFNINYTVCNIGTANAGESNTTIYIDSTAVMEDHVPALAAGENYTNTIGPFNCPCDQTLNVTVCADNDDVVDESDETNNCKVNEVECPAGIPGIEVNKTVWDPEAGEWVDEITACVCDIVRFRCEIHNNGTRCPLTDINVTDTLSDSLEYKNNATVDGVPREPDWIAGNVFRWNFTGPLAPCETITIEFDAHVVGPGVGINTQKAEAIDCYGATVFDEDTATVIGKPDLPDLVIEEIWTKERKDRCKVYFVVKNIGCAPAPKNHHATLLINDQAVEEKRIRKLLGPGEQYESSFRTTVSCTDVIEACADNFKVVDELDENNNCLVLEEKPDLVIENKQEEWVNETHYNVTYVIHNKGTAIAPGGHRTTLYVDGVAIEHKIVPDDLEHCQIYTDTFDTVIQCTDDSDIIRVCADNDGIIDEINEDNNCLQNEWSCEVVGKPDLVIEDIWTRERRDRCKVGFVVRNIGTVAAPCCHHATLFVNGEPVEEKHVRKALRPGRSYKGYFRTTVSCTDVIEVCADNFKVVDELDEDNNCLVL